MMMKNVSVFGDGFEIFEIGKGKKKFLGKKKCN